MKVTDTCRRACEHEVPRSEDELVRDEGEKMRHRENHVPEEVHFEETPMKS